MTSDLLSRAAHSNERVLSGLKVSHRHSISGERLKAGMSLRDLLLIGAQDQHQAWPVWQAFWKELTQPAETAKARTPPVLIAIDGLDHWMGLSKYRSAEFELIHAHQLVLIREFVSMLFSQPSASDLANGGMILATTSGSNSPTLPSFSLLLRQLVARASGVQVTDPKFPMPEPYRKVDQRVLNLLGGSEETAVQTLRGLSRDEARGLLEYFARSGMLKESITEAAVGEKWSLSGGGVIGEIANLGKRVRV
jgi:small subunit ribosomal protein S29